MGASSSGRLLAFDTSTETLSVALGVAGQPPLVRTAPGGAQASTTLLPHILELLAQSGWALDELDAIVFGNGPGSFTGLRTACSVAQGLAFGTQARRPGGVPVLPVDTLLAVAEQARHEAGATQVVAALDARMDQVYTARWCYAAAGWQCDADASLQAPEAVQLPPDWVLAGNAGAVYGGRLAGAPGVAALPTAAALLRLAPQLLAQGQAVPAHAALPRYVRDKVAQTTAERMAARGEAHA